MEDLLILLGIVVVSVAWEKLKKAISNAAEASAPKPRQATREEEAAPEAETEEAVPEEVPAEPRGWKDVPAWDEEEAEEETPYVPNQPDPAPVPESRNRFEEILRRLAEAQPVEVEPEPAPEEVAMPEVPVHATETLESELPIWDLHSEEGTAAQAHPAWNPRAGVRSPARPSANGLKLDRQGLREGVLWSIVLGEPRSRRWMRPRGARR